MGDDENARHYVRGIHVILAHCIDAEQGTSVSGRVIDEQIRACTPEDLLGAGAMATALGTRTLLETVASVAVELVDALRELTTDLDPMHRPTSIEDVVAAIWKRSSSSDRPAARLHAAS